MRFRIHNSNVDETIEAESHDAAMAKFIELHPDESRNAVMIRVLLDAERLREAEARRARMAHSPDGSDPWED